MEEKKGERVAEKVELIYMFVGENLPAMIAMDGSSVRLISDVSWNFEHLVKVKTRKSVNLVNILEGYKEIEIVSPQEL